jgi:hypothetical protein
MKTLGKIPEAVLATDKQLNTIKQYAIALWGDNWLSQLCDAYETKNGYARSSRNSKGNSKVRAWFKGEYKPSLTSFNELLIAVDCIMTITANPRQIL